LKVKTAAGAAKLAGVVACLGGAATLAFYKGPHLQLLSHFHFLGNYHKTQQQQHQGHDWIKGCFLMLLSNTFWGMWLVLQVTNLFLLINQLIDTCLYSSNSHISLILLLLTNYYYSFSHFNFCLYQTFIVKGYPSKLLLTTLQCFLSSIQSLVVALAVERDLEQWKLGWNVRLLAVLYCVIYSILIKLINYIIKKKIDELNYLFLYISNFFKIKYLFS
jgi:hypothetical protein